MPTSWSIGLSFAGFSLVAVLVALRLIRGPIDSMGNYLRPPDPPSKRVQRGLAKGGEKEQEGEKILWETREHPISLFAPLKSWKVDLVLAGAITFALVLSGMAAILLWLSLGSVVGFRALVWDRTRICVTDRRLLVISGIFNIKHKTMPLSKMTDQMTEYNWISNILAWTRIIKIQYATLDVESAGQQQALSKIMYVPHGPAVNRLIMHRVLRPPK